MAVPPAWLAACRVRRLPFLVPYRRQLPPHHQGAADRWPGLLAPRVSQNLSLQPRHPLLPWPALPLALGHSRFRRQLLEHLHCPQPAAVGLVLAAASRRRRRETRGSLFRPHPRRPPAEWRHPSPQEPPAAGPRPEPRRRAPRPALCWASRRALALWRRGGVRQPAADGYPGESARSPPAPHPASRQRASVDSALR